MKRILLSALLVSTALCSSQLMASEMSDDHRAATAAAALPVGFDSRTYANLYPDLQAIYNSLPQDHANEWAASHYLSNGRNEGRNFQRALAAVEGLPAGFDPKVYVTLNPDLQQYMDKHPEEVAKDGSANQWAINHYLSHGKGENRQFQNVAAAAASPAVQQPTYDYGDGGNGVAQLAENWSGQKLGFPLFSYGVKGPVATIRLPKPAFDGYVQVLIKGAYLGPEEQVAQDFYVLVNDKPFPVSLKEGTDGSKDTMAFIPAADLKAAEANQIYELVIPTKFAQENPYLELGFEFQNPPAPLSASPLDEGFVLQNITIQPAIDAFNVLINTLVEQLVKNDIPEDDPKAINWNMVKSVVDISDEEYRAKIAALENEAAVKGINRNLRQVKIEKIISEEGIRLSILAIRKTPAIMDNLEFRAADFWRDNKALIEDNIKSWQKTLAEDKLSTSEINRFNGYLADFEADLRKNAQIRLQRAARMTDGVVDKSIYLTDGNWINGISRHWAGFFVPNKEPFSDIYKVGSFVTLTNKETRQITSIDIRGQYLDIHVEGDTLDSKEVGVPINFTIRDAETKRLEEEAARFAAEAQRLEDVENARLRAQFGIPADDEQKSAEPDA